MFAVIHEEQAHKAGNYIEGTWIIRIDEGVIRTRLHRDGYDNQSYLQTDAWTPNGWAVIVRQTGHEIVLPSVYARDEAIDDKLVLGYVARQQVVARAVLGG